VYGQGYKECENKLGGTIFNSTRKCLLHADDVVVLGHAVKHIAETAEDMTTVATQIGLNTNASKIKCAITRKKNVNEPEGIKVTGQVQKCRNFYPFRLLGNKHKAEQAEKKK
jgi:hypothetical protein